MKFNLTTYKTLTGKKEIVELIEGNNWQAVIYKDEKPSFYVDCYDLQTEANVIMNTLVLCQNKSMSSVISRIAKQNRINISVKEIPVMSLKSDSKTIELDLPPLPEQSVCLITYSEENTSLPLKDVV